MKIIIGLFDPDNAITAVRKLLDSGFDYNELSMMSSSSDIPDYYLETEPEEAAGNGAVIGAVTGGTIGALSSAVASTIPGFESMFVSGLMATAAGSVIGTYLGSIYSVRAETFEEINIDEALANGDILIVAKTEEDALVETAVSVLEKTQGQHIKVHTVPSP